MSDDDLITRADDAVAFLRRVVGDEHPDYPVIDGSGQLMVRSRLDLPELPATSPVRGYLHLYSRRNLDPAVNGDWSVGLVYTDYADRSYRLVRCNGPHANVHVNQIEGDRIVRSPHVHMLTERYQRLRRSKPDAFAYPTDAFETVEQALDHLASLASLVPVGRLFL